MLKSFFGGHLENLDISTLTSKRLEYAILKGIISFRVIVLIKNSRIVFTFFAGSGTNVFQFQNLGEI